MHTFNFLRSLPRYLLSAALVAGITTTVGVFAVDGNPPGLFELDGNTVVDPGGNPGDDWDGLHLDPTDPAGNSAAFTGILADQAPLTIFTGGGSKDIQDVTEWLHKDGSVPDKDDITNAYAAAYTVQDGQETDVHEVGDLIIYFGLDRFANEGDAFAGFWFFQDEVTLNGEPSKGGTKFTGQHVAGDLLVLVEYPQGANAVPEIKVYEWDPLDADNDNVADNLDQIFSSTALCTGSGDKLACAITNVGDLPGAPEWPYVNKDEFAGIPFESFFEGGINVSKLLGGDVPCFSSFLAETRSSRTETAQLKDFVLGEFDLCSIAVTKECEATLNTAGDSIIVNFEGVVTNDGGLSLTGVTVTDDGGTPGAGNTGDDTVIPIGDLAPGDSANYSGSYNTTAIPSTDVVTAEGHRNGSTVTATDDATCSPTVTPAIAVTKECTGATINEAGTGILAEFAGRVTNTGNVKLLGVKVVDDNGTPGVPGDDVTVLGPIDLAPLAFADYSGSYSASGFSSTDEVTATGTDALTQTPVEAKEDATCSATPNPVILVSKQCTDAPAFGQPILFDGTVTNSGNVALLGVTVVDDNGTPLDPLDDVTFNFPDLAPGDSEPYNGSYTPALAGPSTNTVLATATGADGSPVSATDFATCEVPPPPEFEGCTPGFWKTHIEDWEGYSPGQTVGSVFTIPGSPQPLANLANDSLLTALSYEGGNNLAGAARILLRAAVASLLNAAHSEVDFPLTEQKVIDDVNAALATGDRAIILALASDLNDDNNLGCPLGNSL